MAKSAFGAREVTYLVYRLTGEGISPGEAKLKAVSDFPAPISVKQIREFIGLANYFRFLIPNFAFYARIMTCLTKKSSGYKGGKLPDKANSAFLFLKKKLCESPIVSHPKRGLYFHLANDAAAGDNTFPGGFGAVLTQIWHDISEHASRSLKQNENYSAYLLKLAAAVWGIDHFSVYLRGRHFELFSDRKPLETMSKIRKKTLNRLQQQLLEFDFTINYRKGDLNTAADALSRNVPTESGEPDLAVEKFISSMSDVSGSIFLAQKNDPLISDIRQFLAKNVFSREGKSWL